MGCSSTIEKDTRLPKDFAFTKIFQIYEALLEASSNSSKVELNQLGDLNNNQVSNPKSLARKKNYGQKENKRRGSFGSLEILFHNSKEITKFPSLLVNIKENIWAIFTEESHFFENKNQEEDSSQENKVDFKFLPQDASFTYKENSGGKEQFECDSQDLINFHKYIVREMPNKSNKACVQKGNNILVFVMSKDQTATVYKSIGEVQSVATKKENQKNNSNENFEEQVSRNVIITLK